jgi:hypothetical protein
MPRLSMLVIVVPPAADLQGLTVQRDGLTIGRAAWGTRIPVDPGVHVVEANAPGKKTEHLEVHVAPLGDVQTATLAALDDAPAPPAPPSPIAPVVSPSPRATGDVPAASASDPSARETSPARRASLSSRRTWAIVSASAGVLGLGAGSVFGLRAIAEHHDPGATCTTTPCSATSVSLNNQAKFAADFSTASFAVGLVGVGLAAFLWFGDSVAVAPGMGSLQVVGRF